MRVAIIGGRGEDEQHLARIAAKSGHALEFCRPRQTARDDQLGIAVDTLDTTGAHASGAPEQPDEPRLQPRALVFEALDRPDLAILVLRAVRKDPYFDAVGAVIALNADQAGHRELPGGFDDFVLYPFASEELQIRIRALGRRRSEWGSASSPDVEGIVVDEASRDVYVDGRAVQLTAREFALFSYLCEWRGKVLSREHLLARVWGSRYSGGRRTVDIHVRRLRAKLGVALPLETLRGRGYRLRGRAQQAEIQLAGSGDLTTETRLPFKSQSHSQTFPAEPAPA